MSEHPTSFKGLFTTDWIPVKEGMRVPHPESLVQVKFADGTVDSELAKHWNWSLSEGTGQIVEYRYLDKRWSGETFHLGGLKTNKYLRDYPYDTIDIYRVLQVYEVTDPCIQHAVKKLLCAGKRGYKEVEKDVSEAIQSLQRWEEMRKEEDGNSN